MEERIVKPFTMWRHFKGARSFVITVAAHSETGEKFVVYKYITKINFKPKTQNLTRIYFKLTILSIFSIFLKYLSILVQIKELSLYYVSF